MHRGWGGIVGATQAGDVDLGVLKGVKQGVVDGSKKLTPLMVLPSMERGLVSRSSATYAAEKSSSAERWAR